MAVLVAIGVNTQGRKCILGVQVANGESKGSWEKFLSELKKRGLKGVQLVISDAHDG